MAKMSAAERKVLAKFQRKGGRNSAKSRRKGLTPEEFSEKMRQLALRRYAKKQEAAG